MVGIITGKTNNVFDPQGTATRAEVSAVLKRFVELAIFSDTAQGWMMNDSGKWMYYEGGKAVTGNKIIAGRPYQFSATGELINGSSNPETGGPKISGYTVVKGDSWWSIAWDNKCSMLELARINGKTTFSMLYVGDTLKVPEK